MRSSWRYEWIILKWTRLVFSGSSLWTFTSAAERTKKGKGCWKPRMPGCNPWCFSELYCFCGAILSSYLCSVFLGEACQVSRCHWSLGMHLKFLAFSICVRIAILFKATSELRGSNGGECDGWSIVHQTPSISDMSANFDRIPVPKTSFLK